MFLCFGGDRACGHGGPILPLWWLAVLRKGLVLAAFGVVRSRPFGGWLLYAKVRCSPLHWCDLRSALWYLASSPSCPSTAGGSFLSSPGSLSDVKLCARFGGFLRWWSDPALGLAVLRKDVVLGVV